MPCNEKSEMAVWNNETIKQTNASYINYIIIIGHFIRRVAW